MFFFKKVYKLLKLLKFKLWRKGLLNGIAASIELEKILKNINPETVIDIGSNKGQFVMLIEQLFPNKIIYSFEPILEVLEKQKKLPSIPVRHTGWESVVAFPTVAWL